MQKTRIGLNSSSWPYLVQFSQAAVSLCYSHIFISKWDSFNSVKPTTGDEKCFQLQQDSGTRSSDWEFITEFVLILELRARLFAFVKLAYFQKTFFHDKILFPFLAISFSLRKAIQFRGYTRKNLDNRHSAWISLIVER